MSKSASGWVTPEQLTALHPASAQMLYRFTHAATDAQVATALAGATEGLPADAVGGVQTHLTLARAYSAMADAYLPFITLFGVLGLLVSVLIVGNVVSGAVVSGQRHIGVLKALGFTPNQVVAVYLMMLSVPALAGGVLGTLAGHALTGPILKVAFTGIETGLEPADAPPSWVPAVCLVGVPALVLLAALVPALRAHRLPAARAISAGDAPRTGRGLRVQRALSGTSLPRPVSMGLGQPFTRPGRTLLTMAAIVVGVTTVTFSTGLTNTLLAAGDAGRGGPGPRVQVEAGRTGNGRSAPALPDAELEERLRSLPGAKAVRARAFFQANLVGQSQPIYADFYRGDDSPYAQTIVEGRAPRPRARSWPGPRSSRSAG